MAQDDTVQFSWDDLMAMPLADRIAVYLGIKDGLVAFPEEVDDDLVTLLSAALRDDTEFSNLIAQRPASPRIGPIRLGSISAEEADRAEDMWATEPEYMKAVQQALDASALREYIELGAPDKFGAWEDGVRAGEAATRSLWSLGFESALALSMVAAGGAAGGAMRGAYGAARGADFGRIGAAQIAGKAAIQAPLAATGRGVGSLLKWEGRNALKITGAITKRPPTEVAAALRAAGTKMTDSRLGSIGKFLGKRGYQALVASTAVGAGVAGQGIIQAYMDPESVIWDPDALGDLDAEVRMEQTATGQITGVTGEGILAMGAEGAAPSPTTMAQIRQIAGQVQQVLSLSDPASAATAGAQRARTEAEAAPAGTAAAEAQPPEPGGGASYLDMAPAPGIPTEAVGDEEDRFQSRGRAELGPVLGGFEPEHFRGGGTPSEVGAPSVYREWHTRSIVGNLPPSRLAGVQGLMVNAGLIDPDQRIGGAAHTPGRIDMATLGAMENVLTLANANRMPWNSMLDVLVEEHQKTLADERETVVPFIRQAYVAPSYEELAQQVKAAASSYVGRDLQDWETKLLADQLGGFYFEDYEAQIAAQRASFEAEREAERIVAEQEAGTAKGTPTTTVADRAVEQIEAGPTYGARGYPEVEVAGTARPGDPAARIAETIEARFKDEKDMRRRVDESAQNFSTMMASLSGIERKVAG